MAAPTLTAVTPNNGPIGVATPVSISGNNFVAGCTVAFNGVPATSVVIVGPTQITCATPATMTPAFVPVTVTNPSLEVGTLPNGYRFHALSFDPDTERFSGPCTDVIIGLNGAKGDILEGFILWPYVQFNFPCYLRDGSGALMQLLPYGPSAGWINLESRPIPFGDFMVRSQSGPWKITLGTGMDFECRRRSVKLQGVTA